MIRQMYSHSRKTHSAETFRDTYQALRLLGNLPLRGLQQMVSATQCRPPEFGRRAAISFAECGAEMTVTGKAQVLA
jgi:16S rRNA C1402 N4-methylase RsmH